MMCPIAFYYHAKNYKLLMNGLEENVQKTKFLTLNPSSSPYYEFFQNPSRLTFFNLLTPNLMQNVRKREPVTTIFNHFHHKGDSIFFNV